MKIIFNNIEIFCEYCKPTDKDCFHIDFNFNKKSNLIYVDLLDKTTIDYCITNLPYTKMCFSKNSPSIKII